MSTEENIYNSVLSSTECTLRAGDIFSMNTRKQPHLGGSLVCRSYYKKKVYNV